MKNIKHLILLGGISMALAIPGFAQDNSTGGATDPEPSGGPDRERRLGGIVDRIQDRITLPDDLNTAIDEYQATQQTLRQDLADQISALENPTREQVREVTDQFKADNADLIAAQQELAQSIRDEVSALRMENAPDRPEVPEAVQEAREQFRQQRQSMVQSRQQLREDLAAATSEEERRALITAFREQQRENVQDLREVRRTLREQLRDGGDGDRRGGTGG